jgi:hypothetical protein
MHLVKSQFLNSNEFVFKDEEQLPMLLNILEMYGIVLFRTMSWRRYRGPETASVCWPKRCEEA